MPLITLVSGSEEKKEPVAGTLAHAGAVSQLKGKESFGGHGGSEKSLRDATRTRGRISNAGGGGGQRGKRSECDPRIAR